MGVRTQGSLAHIQTLDSYLLSYQDHKESSKESARQEETLRAIDTLFVSSERATTQSCLHTAKIFDSKRCLGVKGSELLRRADLESFNTMLQKIFEEKEIDTSYEISLSLVYGSEHVIVTSEHPDQEKIEKIFADDCMIRNEYMRLTTIIARHEEGKDRSLFHKAYRLNPQYAARRFEYLLNSHIETTVHLFNGSIDVTTDRVSA
jgi:hypothetical protein